MPSPSSSLAAATSSEDEDRRLARQVHELQAKVAQLELRLRAGLLAVVGIGLALLVAQVGNTTLQTCLVVGLLTVAWVYLTFTKEPAIQAVQIARLHQARKEKSLAAFRRSMNVPETAAFLDGGGGGGGASAASNVSNEPTAPLLKRSSSAASADSVTSASSFSATSPAGHAPIARRDTFDPLRSDGSDAGVLSESSAPVSPALRPRSAHSALDTTTGGSRSQGNFAPQGDAGSPTLKATKSFVSKHVSDKKISSAAAPTKVESRLKQGTLYTRQIPFAFVKRYGVLVSTTTVAAGQKGGTNKVFDLRVGKDAMELVVGGNTLSTPLTPDSELRAGRSKVPFNKTFLYEFTLRNPGAGHNEVVHCATDSDADRQQWMRHLRQCITALNVSKQLGIDAKNRDRVRKIVQPVINDLALGSGFAELMLEDVTKALSAEMFELDSRTYRRWQDDIRGWVRAKHRLVGGRSHADVEREKQQQAQQALTETERIAPDSHVPDNAAHSTESNGVLSLSEAIGGDGCQDSTSATRAAGHNEADQDTLAASSSAQDEGEVATGKTRSISSDGSPTGDDNDDDDEDVHVAVAQDSGAEDVGKAESKEEFPGQEELDSQHLTEGPATDAFSVQDSDADEGSDDLGVLPTEDGPPRPTRSNSHGVGQQDAAKLPNLADLAILPAVPDEGEGADLPSDGSSSVAPHTSTNSAVVPPKATDGHKPSDHSQATSAAEVAGTVPDVHRWWDDIAGVRVVGLVKTKEKKYNGLLEGVAATVMEYALEVRLSTGESWKVSHRYSAFSGLYEEILRTKGGRVALPAFPSKDGGLKKELEQQRLHGFSAIMAAVVSNRETLEIPAVQRFLQPIDYTNRHDFSRLRCGGAMFWVFKQGSGKLKRWYHKFVTIAQDGLRIYDQRMSMLTHAFTLRQLIRVRLTTTPKQQSSLVKQVLPFMVLVDVDGGDGTPVRLVLGVKSEEQGHNVEIAFQTTMATLPPALRTRTRVDERMIRGESYFVGRGGDNSTPRGRNGSAASTGGGDSSLSQLL